MRCGILLPRRLDERKAALVLGWRVLPSGRCAGASKLQSGILLRCWVVDCEPVPMQQLCRWCHVFWWARGCVLLGTLRGRLLLPRVRCADRVHDVPRGSDLRR